MILSIIFIVIFSIMNEYFRFQIIATVLMIICLIWARFGYKHSLRKRYEIHTNDNNKLFYTSFRRDIEQNGISKELLIKAKDILEIETEEEPGYSSTRFDSFIYLIIVEIMSMLLIDYIKCEYQYEYQLMAYVLIVTISLYMIVSLIEILFINKKSN